MMQPRHIKVYRDGVHVGTVEPISMTTIHEDIDGVRKIAIARVKNSHSNIKEREVVLLAFTDNEPCGCTHDCCGCMSYWATLATSMGDNIYAVDIYGARNV